MLARRPPMLRRLLAPTLLLAASVTASCEGGDERAQPVGPGAVCAQEQPGPLGYSRYSLDDVGAGPAWVGDGDLDGDGRLDLVVSSVGPVGFDDGAVHLTAARVAVFLQGESVGCWRRIELLGPAAGLYFPNEPTLADLDRDGDLDVVVPFGFFVCQFDEAVRRCGALAWFENDGSGERFERHDLLGPGTTRFHHRAVVADLDADGIDDLLTVGEDTSGAEVLWLRGSSDPAPFEATPRVIGPGLGSLPVVRDLDGDGDLDIASAEYFHAERSFVWLEQVEPPSPTSPAGTFVDHTIDDGVGPAIQLALVEDLFGDGRTIALGSNHTNRTSHPEEPESGLYAYEVPADPRAPWPRRRLSDGVTARPNEGFTVAHAPGVFGWGDADGDGDLDIALSGDGDARTFLLEQTAPGTFAQHVLEQDNGQAGGALVVDLDGDGDSELVFTGYERSAVLVYSR